MKLTWFGGTTVRIHIGGQILIGDAEAAEPSVDYADLRGAADIEFRFADWEALEPVNLGSWRPARRTLPIDGDPGVPVRLSAQAGAILVEAPGESPLLLLRDKPPEIGRLMLEAIVIILGDKEALKSIGDAVLSTFPPKVLALAGPPNDMDVVFPHLAAAVEETGLIALEEGLAVEV